MKRAHQHGVLICLSLALAACGGRPDGLVGVSGTVSLDGQPLPEATLLFKPVGGGRPSAAITDQRGDYELEYTAGTYGARPGRYRVSITTARTVEEESGQEVSVPEKLPPKYNARTELEVEVGQSGQPIDFELDSEGELPRDTR